MRLINADALKEKAWDADTRCGYVQVVDVGDIDAAPTIEMFSTSGYVTTSTDEPPVVYAEQKRGKWKEDTGGFSCTVCGYHTDDDEIGNWDITFGRWKYCPSCGAKMTEDNRKEQYGEIR